MLDEYDEINELAQLYCNPNTGLSSAHKLHSTFDKQIPLKNKLLLMNRWAIK